MGTQFEFVWNLLMLFKFYGLSMGFNSCLFKTIDQIMSGTHFVSRIDSNVLAHSSFGRMNSPICLTESSISAICCFGCWKSDKAEKSAYKRVLCPGKCILVLAIKPHAFEKELYSKVNPALSKGKLNRPAPPKFAITDRM